MAKMRRWTEKVWGVLYKDAENFRAAGTIETFGIRPGGDTGPFDRGICEYIVRGNPTNRVVVCKTIEHEVVEYDWVYIHGEAPETL